VLRAAAFDTGDIPGIPEEGAGQRGDAQALGGRGMNIIAPVAELQPDAQA